MQTLKVTKILIGTVLLLTATTLRAETVVSNVVLVSSHSDGDGEAAVSTSIISTVDGETTEYHYSSEGSTSSTIYWEETMTDEEVGDDIDGQKSRAIYLMLIEKLLDLIDLLKAKT